MTIEDKIHFQILERLLTIKNTDISKQQYYTLTEGIKSANHDYVFNKMKEKGYIVDGNNYIDEKYPQRKDGSYNTVYRLSITDLGEAAYHGFKKQHINETVKKVAFWILFVSSIVSAIYGVLTYYAPSSNNQPLQKSTTAPAQITAPQPRIEKSDTIKGRLLDSPSILKNNSKISGKSIPTTPNKK